MCCGSGSTSASTGSGWTPCRTCSRPREPTARTTRSRCGLGGGRPVRMASSPTSRPTTPIRSSSFRTRSFNNVYYGAKMNGVWLHIFDSWAWTCTPKPFWVNAITQPWVVNSSKTYPGPSFDGNALGSVTADPGVACTNTSGDRTVGTWITVPLSTGLFQTWALNGTNYGLAVTASQTDSTQWKRFTLRNSSAGMGLAPYLEVAYTSNVAPQVDAQYPPSGYAATTLTPELLVAGRDPDAWPNPVQYDFLVYDKDSNKIAESGWTAATNWRVPAAKLSWGQTYRWTVLASDGFLASSSQTLNVLSTPVPQPVVTSGLAQNGGQGFEPNVATTPPPRRTRRSPRSDR